MAQNKNDEMWLRLQEYFNADELYAGLDLIMKKKEILFERLPILKENALELGGNTWKEMELDDGTRYYKVIYENSSDSVGYPTDIYPPGYIKDETDLQKKRLVELETEQAEIQKTQPDEPIEHAGGTHYVYFPPEERENSSAVLRAGFISSERNALTKDFNGFDVLKGEKYSLHKRFFNSKYQNKSTNYPS